MIDEVCQQKMKTEEGRTDKKVIHRMNLDFLNCRENKQQEEKKKQGDGSEVRDVTYPRTGIEFVRHCHPDLNSC